MRIFKYKGFGECDSMCGVDRYGTMIICTELDINQGTSITNMASELATMLCEEYDISPDHLIWIEHYPPRSDGRDRFLTNSEIDQEGSYDLVQFNLKATGEKDYTGPMQRLWEKGHKQAFIHPRWTRVDKEVVEALKESMRRRRTERGIT